MVTNTVPAGQGKPGNGVEQKNVRDRLRLLYDVQTQFQTVWRQNYADTFSSYTGRKASGKEIANILKNAPSIYTLSTTLALTKSFQSSPIYKAHAPGVIAIAKSRSRIGITWRKPSLRVSSRTLLFNPTRPMITNPPAWIAIVTTVRD